MGTPHRGTPHAQLGNIVLSVVNKMLNNTRSKFLAPLTPNHEDLMGLNDDVSEILSEIQIVDYFECLPMKNMTTCVRPGLPLAHIFS